MHSTSRPAFRPDLTAIQLTNSGKEEHQAQLVKIADGKSMTDLPVPFKIPTRPPPSS